MENTNADIAYSTLLEMISNRTILPGQKLIENDLSIQLGMSRTPVREALRKLQHDGLVENIANKGSFVKAYTFSEMADGYEIVSMLTGMACRHIAMDPQKIASSSFEELSSLIIKMDQAVLSSDKQTWVKLDIDFHRRIIELAAIWQLTNTYSHLVVWINQVLWHVTPIYVDIESSTNDHKKILQLLKDGLSDEAQQFAQSHQMKTVNIIRDISKQERSLFHIRNK